MLTRVYEWGRKLSLRTTHPTAFCVTRTGFEALDVRGVTARAFLSEPDQSGHCVPCSKVQIAYASPRDALASAFEDLKRSASKLKRKCLRRRFASAPRGAITT